MAQIIARRNAPIPTPLSIIRGDTSIFSITLVGTDGETPVNLTGSQVYFSAKWALSDPTSDAALAVSTVSGGITVVSAPAGTITVSISPLLTNPLPNDRIELFYDLRQSVSATEAYTALRGTLLIAPSVTTL